MKIWVGLLILGFLIFLPGTIIVGSFIPPVYSMGIGLFLLGLGGFIGIERFIRRAKYE